MYYSIEIVRLLAVILITFTHIRHSFDDGFMFILLERVPLYGTLILSIISGFLYAEVSSKKGNLFQKKVKSLLIPFLIANLTVIVLALVANAAGFDMLNRLSFGWELITEGLFSLTSPPVNPPTYFIRDIFVIFVMIAAVRTKNVLMLLGIILWAYFGELLYRYDILVLFCIGVFLSRTKVLYNEYFVQSILTGIVVTALFFFTGSDFARHALSMVLFLLMIRWRVRFITVGGYSYTLHLYHSPVIVVTYPLLLPYIQNPYLLVVFQIVSAYAFCFLFYFLIKKFRLGFVIGGRY